MDCLLYGTSIWDLSLTWEGSFSTLSFFLKVWDVWMCCCHQLTLIRVFTMLSSSILCLVQLGGRHFLYCAWVSDTLIVSFLTSACPDRHIHGFWLNYCHFVSAVLMARMERLCNNDVLECEGEWFFSIRLDYRVPKHDQGFLLCAEDFHVFERFEMHKG